ncbi:Zinc resistance conferring protein [Lecanora helva]
MGLSKSTRIIILLGIDSAFFLLELIVGYGVHSLALVADSFHMLNDVLSLCVGLWAVKVANQKNSKMFTYGWQRAETLGALVNGVFLVALCLSIFLDAVQRFVEPQTVSNPRLVLIVGSFGLLSNILGLFLFHEHSHSHGGEGGHAHGNGNTIAEAEEGNSRAKITDDTTAVADESGNVAKVLPLSVVAGWPGSDGLQNSSEEGSGEDSTQVSQRFTRSDEEGSTATNSTSPLSIRKTQGNSTRRSRRLNSKGSGSRFSSSDDIPVHPASFRKGFIKHSHLENIESRDGSESGGEEAVDTDIEESTERTPLIRPAKSNGSAPAKDSRYTNLSHADHKHNRPAESSGSGHSHGDLNMRGVFLHVMGDALGNIGVIGSALFIWLTKFSWRFYVDPGISLIITVIILGSAIPLCKAASRILLQAVPAGIDVDDIKADIKRLPGVLSCHHLHVWQLSDVKKIASLHVQVEFDFKGEGSARYMKLAHAISDCLHGHGIHNSTIQPEFCLDSEHRHISGAPSDNGGSDSVDSVSEARGASKKGSSCVSVRSQPEACLLECGDACNGEGQCCAPATAEGDTHNEEGHSH